MPRKKQHPIEPTVFKGEYLAWLISLGLFAISAKHLFGFAGLLMASGLFGLIGILLVNIKQVLRLLENA